MGGAALGSTQQHVDDEHIHGSDSNLNGASKIDYRQQLSPCSVRDSELPLTLVELVPRLQSA